MHAGMAGWHADFLNYLGNRKVQIIPVKSITKLTLDLYEQKNNFNPEATKHA